MEKVNLSRQDLYDLVWSEHLSALSKKYCISDNGLRKICVKINIPLPQNGHWQRIRYGKSIVKMKLPDNYAGENEVSLFLRGKDENGVSMDQSPLKRLTKEIENNADLPLKVPSTLTNPDKLIIAAKNTLNSRNARSSNYSGMVETVRGELTIRVSPVNVDRALRIFNTLIKLLHARKHSIIIRNVKTYAVVKGKELEISLKEKLRIVYVKDGSWERREYHPTGVLGFKVDGYSGKEWQDGKQPLEDQLTNILAKLETLGAMWKEIWHKNDEERRQREERERITRELKERKEKELQDFKNLLKEANRWQQAKILREYLNALEVKAIEESTLSDELKNWLSWARQKADWYDPLSRKEDAILNDSDRLKEL